MSDWYDGGVGGHGYNNPDQGRIFLLKPKGKQLARREKPGPYANVADAIEGLKSPNLATQFLARERLLAERRQSVPALVGAARRRRAEQSGPGAVGARSHRRRRARAGRSAQLQARRIRRFARWPCAFCVGTASEYGDAILALADDSSAEVRREVLLAIRNLQGDAAEAALAKMAATYDGTDRYQLEAINIAAGRSQAGAAGAAGKERPALSRAVSAGASARARAGRGRLLLARLTSNRSSTKRRRAAVLDAAVNIPSLDAGWGLLELAAADAIARRLRRAALEKVVANVDRARRLVSDGRGPAVSPTALAALLADEMRASGRAASDRTSCDSRALGGERAGPGAGRQPARRRAREQAIQSRRGCSPRERSRPCASCWTIPTRASPGGAGRTGRRARRPRLREILAGDKFSRRTAPRRRPSAWSTRRRRRDRCCCD